MANGDGVAKGTRGSRMRSGHCFFFFAAPRGCPVPWKRMHRVHIAFKKKGEATNIKAKPANKHWGLEHWQKRSLVLVPAKVTGCCRFRSEMFGWCGLGVEGLLGRAKHCRMIRFRKQTDTCSLEKYDRTKKKDVTLPKTDCSLFSGFRGSGPLSSLVPCVLLRVLIGLPVQGRRRIAKQQLSRAERRHEFWNTVLRLLCRRLAYTDHVALVLVLYSV